MLVGYTPTEANQLVDIRQKDDESLKAYIQRFMQAASRAKTVGDEGKMMAITAGVKHKTGLWKSLRKNGVRTMQEFLDRADQYMQEFLDRADQYLKYEPKFTNYTGLVSTRAEYFRPR